MYDAYDRYLAYEMQEAYTWLIDEFTDAELIVWEVILSTLYLS